MTSRTPNRKLRSERTHSERRTTEEEGANPSTADGEPRRPESERELRSRIMRSVRRERTTPEESVAAFLRARGVRYRRNVRSLPGSPDLANRTRRFAIYVHGCFWHRHDGCARATTPKGNAEFWRMKFDANVARDQRKEEALRAMGFQVTTVWECQTRSDAEMERALGPLLRSLETN